MQLLRWLESLRTPALDSFFAAVTEFGGETVFLVLSIVIFWCISKRCGYFILLTCFFGMVINQFLKITCRVPRPWTVDPNFTIVEAARADARGYSFPSGHTQNTVGTFGALFLYNKNRLLRIVCAAAIVLIAFSRMYLGVHTLFDVGISMLLALALLAVLWPVFRDADRLTRLMPRLLLLGVTVSAVFCAYMLLWRFPADIDAVNLSEAVKTAFTLFGSLAAFMLIYFLDTRYIRFDPKAPLPGQILKLVLGLIVLLAIKEGLKAPLNTLLGGHAAADAVRYFFIIVFAGAVWPLTFPFFSKIGKRKENPDA